MELFRKSAGYRFLDAFVLANVVELGTRHFCNRFLDNRNDPGGRTFAQMTHAARSGCRNFAEGSERLKRKVHQKIGDEFAETGGFRERLSTVRSESRATQNGDATAEVPNCPQCGAPMRLRESRKDNRAFWGCTEYPACRGVIPVDDENKR